MSHRYISIEALENNCSDLISSIWVLSIIRWYAIMTLTKTIIEEDFYDLRYF